MKKVCVGIIGSGFAAGLHLEAYRRVCGLEVQLKAIPSIAANLNETADQYGIQDRYENYHHLLEDPEIDVVDIIVPPALHFQCILDALQAGKHVICEKPLTGYFGNPNDTTPIGIHVDKKKMLDSVEEQLEQLRTRIEKSGKIFMYAENWIYAPAVQKLAEVIRSKKTKQLFLKAEESHIGSHAEHAAHWSQNGGGSLIRQGCHPLSAVLYLKTVEAEARGERIAAESVLCDCAKIADRLDERDKRLLASRPVDVEDWAEALYTFSDGTKASIISGDMALGGVRNYLEVYGSDAVLLANISPNNSMQSYFADEEGLDSIYLTEKAQTKLGWQSVFLDEISMRGYAGEIQDFMECAACGRQPISGFELACETTKAIYAAYLSAEQNKRVKLS